MNRYRIHPDTDIPIDSEDFDMPNFKREVFIPVILTDMEKALCSFFPSVVSIIPPGRIGTSFEVTTRYSKKLWNAGYDIARDIFEDPNPFLLNAEEFNALMVYLSALSDDIPTGTLLVRIDRESRSNHFNGEEDEC